MSDKDIGWVPWDEWFRFQAENGLGPRRCCELQRMLFGPAGDERRTAQVMFDYFKDRLGHRMK